MENREIAIKISGLKKTYKLGEIGGTTLQEACQSIWARFRGKEDPNVRIDQTQRLKGKIFNALNGIDLTIYKGETIGIIGSNGAGKSTMLKILSRITAPTEGEIDIYGRVTSMLEVGTGFNGEMTGRENIYLNGAILGMTKGEIDSKIEDIIDFAEIREFIDTPVKRYSSGMYVKLAFSVAAHLDSEIMIMDEVLAVGDMKFQEKCLGRMGSAADIEGKTVLYVSHNMNTIRQLCSRCVVLDQGKIIYDGDVENAIEIYMKNQGNINCTYYDYMLDSWVQDMRNPAIQKVNIKWVKIREKQSALYCSGEHIVFDMGICTEKSVEKLLFRFEIRYADGTPVGTALDIELGSTEANMEKVFRMKFDTSVLTRGKYQTCLVLYEKNEFGTLNHYDVIVSAFSFEIEDKIDITWDTVWWGHIKLPTLICQHIDEKTM